MGCVHFSSAPIAAFSGEEIGQGTRGTAKLEQVWKGKKDGGRNFVNGYGGWGGAG